MTTTNGHFALTLEERIRGALLGAAVGDALGWPEEFPRRRTKRSQLGDASVVAPLFQTWVRRDGGRFSPHDEQILPGEYSDDTQLLLCTARSVIKESGWWDRLAWRELPTWKLYERGGGAATNRAVRAWLSGQHPWVQHDVGERHEYFQAGGNGVAMRILPHCLSPWREFSSIARDIVTNGVCTHGHPRALIGALAYGYAVWLALRNDTTLQYGQLISECLSDVQTWSALPSIDDAWPTWRGEADSAFADGFEHEWKQVTREVTNLLSQASEALSQGALAVDREVLHLLGCFGKEKGSGTITAVASVFLASRFAADPMHGLLEASHASGADTDTLASMTGGLLGIISGSDWLGERASNVQDSRYIEKLANLLITRDGTTSQEPVDLRPVKKSSLESLRRSLARKADGDPVSLPDGREANVLEVIQHPSKSKTSRAVSWKLVADDGQVIYVKKYSRGSSTPENRDEQVVNKMSSHALEAGFTDVAKLGVTLPVTNVPRARDFYSHVLGLKIASESPSGVKFSCGILLVPSQRRSDLEWSRRDGQLMAGYGPTVSLEVRFIEPIFERTKAKGARIVSPPAERKGWMFFRCFDIDGYIIEFLERRAEDQVVGDTEPQHPDDANMGYAELSGPADMGVEIRHLPNSESASPSAGEPEKVAKHVDQPTLLM